MRNTQPTSRSMASASSPDSDVSSTTVQVTSLGGQQIFQSGKGQQYLIVNQALQGSGGRIQIVTSEKQDGGDSVLDAMRRREILARQPSYCKILNDLKEVESSESEEQELAGEPVESKEEKAESEVGQDLVMKGEAIEVVEGSPATQTVVINGQAYQIVTPINLVGGVSTASSVPPSQTVNTAQFSSEPSNGGTAGSVFIPAGSQEQQIVTVQSNTNGSSGNQAEEAARKREVRLMKNREAARECRNKKKEYIKCLENRVAVLENQNKALIEELKSLKELYTGQNSSG